MQITIKGKKYQAEICDTLLKKARGLMFRKKPQPLFFVFKKPTRQPIHSFFCKPFQAIWLNNGKIIDDKKVKPFRIFVRPKKSFTHLLEIPLKNQIVPTGRKV